MIRDNKWDEDGNVIFERTEHDFRYMMRWLGLDY